jgi:hypothetical protein
MRLRHKPTRPLKYSLAAPAPAGAAAHATIVIGIANGHMLDAQGNVVPCAPLAFDAAGRYPGQAMSLEGTFHCFTLDAAYAAHQEKTLGSLEVDKYGDFFAADRDLFQVSPYDIHRIGVPENLGGRAPGPAEKVNRPARTG